MSYSQHQVTTISCKTFEVYALRRSSLHINSFTLDICSYWTTFVNRKTAPANQSASPCCSFTPLMCFVPLKIHVGLTICWEELREVKYLEKLIVSFSTFSSLFLRFNMSRMLFFNTGSEWATQK